MCKSVWAISILVGQNKLLNWFTLFSVICTLSQWWMLTLKRNDCSNNEVNVPTSNPCQLKAQATARVSGKFLCSWLYRGNIPNMVTSHSSRYEHKSEQTVASKMG